MKEITRKKVIYNKRKSFHVDDFLNTDKFLGRNSGKFSIILWFYDFFAFTAVGTDEKFFIARKVIK